MAADTVLPSPVDFMPPVAAAMNRTVPNHILDTKIFSQVGKSALVHANPAVLYFSGFHPHHRYSKTLRLTNAGNHCQRFHVIPPTTPHFSIKFNNKGSLVPGLSIEVKVEFRPDGYHNYHDMIRVHCQNEENVVVHIYAYPVMDASQFPRDITFAATPINQSKVQVFPLQNLIPVQFEFQLSVLSHHPAFTVEPMDGIIPACGSVEIHISFKPLDYTTAMMKLQLSVSQFNFEPIVCTVTGSSMPGLLKELQEHTADAGDDSSVSDTESDLDPRSVTPLERTRLKRQVTKPVASTHMQPINSQPSNVVVYQGVRFPNRLDNPHAVAAVLNQQNGKLKAKDLKSVTSLITESSGEIDTRQLKEAAFEQQMRKTIAEEQANQLRWVTQLGDEYVTEEARHGVLKARKDADTIYRVQQRIAMGTVEFNRSITTCCNSKTRRLAHEGSSFQPKFSLYENDTWGRRQTALNRFVQAARKVIVRARAQERLRYLQNFIDEWKKGNFSFKSQIDLVAEEGQNMEMIDLLGLNLDSIVPLPLAGYRNEDNEHGTPPDTLFGLCQLPPPSGHVKTSVHVPFAHIWHPMEYRLLGYEAIPFADSREYHPPGLRNPLQIGAEDELIHLGGIVAEQPSLTDGPTRPSTHTSQRDIKEIPTDDTTTSIRMPPSNLTAPIDYPSLHIFSPIPGLQKFHEMLPYSEVDDNYQFCPQPVYPTQTTRETARGRTRLDLDREDVIPGFMQWKTFPCQSLVAAGSVPSLSSVWLPRWTDPFGSDFLLPFETPELLDCLPDDDAPPDTEEEDESMPALEPDMIAAAFTIPEKPEAILPPAGSGFADKLPTRTIACDRGLVPREYRSEQLTAHLIHRQNRLGVRLQQRIGTMESFLTEAKLRTGNPNSS